MLFEKNIRFYRETDWPALRAFIVRQTHDRYILADKRYFDWQFSPPGWNTGTPSFLVLENKAEILGYLGLIPLKMNYHGREFKGGCLVNIMTDQSLRAKGVGISLITKAEKEIGDLAYTVCFIPPLDVIYDRLGWSKEQFLKRFVLVLDAQAATALADEPVHFETMPSEISLTEVANYVFSEQIFCDSRVDDLWSRLKQKYSVTIVRDAEYLNWRYSRHPFLKYKLFLLEKEGRAEAFAVLRVEETNGYRVVRIVDFMATDEAERVMLSYLVDFCRQKKVQLLDFMFTGQFHRNALIDCGFRDGSVLPYSLLPIRFNPIDRRMMTINFSYKFLAHDLLAANNKSDADHWYVTKGDGDQDRPNPR